MLMSSVAVQTLQHHRTPYATEITEEVGHEYNRQQEERRNAVLQKGNDMEDVRGRVVDIETSVARLGEQVGTSQHRMEEMLNAILLGQGLKMSSPAEGVMLPPVAGVDSAMPSLASAGNTSASPRKTAVSDVLSLHGGPSAGGSAGKASDVVEKGRSTNAPSVDEFLAELLQNPHDLRGSGDMVHPSQAVVLAGRTGNAREDGETHDVAALGNPHETPSKQSDGTDSNVALQVSIRA